jgi:hypothetical protein
MEARPLPNVCFRFHMSSTSQVALPCHFLCGYVIFYYQPMGGQHASQVTLYTLRKLGGLWYLKKCDELGIRNLDQ